jgi:hypothetical protein
VDDSRGKAEEDDPRGRGIVNNKRPWPIYQQYRAFYYETNIPRQNFLFKFTVIDFTKISKIEKGCGLFSCSECLGC